VVSPERTGRTEVHRTRAKKEGKKGRNTDRPSSIKRGGGEEESGVQISRVFFCLQSHLRGKRRKERKRGREDKGCLLTSNAMVPRSPEQPVEDLKDCYTQKNVSLGGKEGGGAGRKGKGRKRAPGSRPWEGGLSGGSQG